MNNKYQDIINLPHYEPKKHPRMSIFPGAVVGVDMMINLAYVSGMAIIQEILLIGVPIKLV